MRYRYHARHARNRISPTMARVTLSTVPSRIVYSFLLRSTVILIIMGNQISAIRKMTTTHNDGDIFSVFSFPSCRAVMITRSSPMKKVIAPSV